MRNPRLIFCLFLIAMLGAGGAFGQAVNATVVGTVTDQTGGVIVSAKVVITETNTGASRTANTNDSGNYSFPNLPPGTYSVTVAQAGFKKVTHTGVDVLVDTTTRADFILMPGQVTESVEVSAESAILQTDRADIGRKIETAQMANLPLGYGRNFQALLNLVPAPPGPSSRTRSFSIPRVR